MSTVNINRARMAANRARMTDFIDRNRDRLGDLVDRTDLYARAEERERERRREYERRHIESLRKVVAVRRSAIQDVARTLPTLPPSRAAVVEASISLALKKLEQEEREIFAHDHHLTITRDDQGNILPFDRENEVLFQLGRVHV